MIRGEKMECKKGFTLIELLVVIAIIAILAAILFPVFAQAREKARQTTCLSNVKQLCLGMLMYAQDWDETFPGGWESYPGGKAGWTIDAGGIASWTSRIFPYLKSRGIGHCPSDPICADAMSYKAAAGCTYDPANIDSFYWDPNIPTFPPLKSAVGICGMFGATLGSMPAPAETILLLCAPNNPINYGSDDWVPRIQPGHWYFSWIEDGTLDTNIDAFDTLGVSWIKYQTCWNSMLCYSSSQAIADPWGSSFVPEEPWYISVHNGGSNYGFGDGHAKWMRLEATLYPKNLWTLPADDSGWNPFGWGQ